jgi:hypothetical protein
MSGAPDSMAFMVGGNRPASLCPVLSRPVDLSFVRYDQLVVWRRLPGICLLDPSLSVGLIPMLLWSTLVVNFSATSSS